jgi:hypothetical protein
MMLASGLLSLLGSTSARDAQPSATPADHASPAFASLLEQARAGEIASGREITIASSADLKLTPDQLQRLALAADRAEAQGATRAIVLMDGQAFRVDITMREITGAVDINSPAVLTGIDALVTVPDMPGTSNPAAVAPTGPSRGWSNASLLKSLAGDDHHGKAH